jgi:hypothetical protein
MEYDNVTQKVLSGNAILAALMTGIKYDAIPDNGKCSRESHRNPDNNLESPCMFILRNCKNISVLQITNHLES